MEHEKRLQEIRELLNQIFREAYHGTGMRNARLHNIGVQAEKAIVLLNEFEAVSPDEIKDKEL